MPTAKRCTTAAKITSVAAAIRLAIIISSSRSRMRRNIGNASSAQGWCAPQQTAIPKCLHLVRRRHSPALLRIRLCGRARAALFPDLSRVVQERSHPGFSESLCRSQGVWLPYYSVADCGLDRRRYRTWADGREAKIVLSPRTAHGFYFRGHRRRVERKSKRLNSSHLGISYAVFCL